jgi:hypothetical protein
MELNSFSFLKMAKMARLFVSVSPRVDSHQSCVRVGMTVIYVRVTNSKASKTRSVIDDEEDGTACACFCTRIVLKMSSGGIAPI